MVKVTVGSTTKKVTELYPSDRTLRQILDSQHIDYSSSIIMLDGANIRPGDLDRTLADLGIQDRCMLIASVKSENANA